MLRPDGNLLADGYAGFGAGKNNPDMQDRPNVGPIPRGYYTIGPSTDDPRHGPVSMRLTPYPTNEMHGRAGFLIHADSVHHPGTASLGCIVLPRFARDLIAASPDRVLCVIA